MDERAGISNNDVYTGPYDTTDNDGDGLVNEDNVDGEDDDNDGKLTKTGQEVTPNLKLSSSKI